MSGSAEFPFGPEVVAYLQGVKWLIPEFDNRRYRFQELDAFKGIASTNLAEGMRVYWSEMLMRAHLAATTSILRNHRWLSGALLSVEEQNLLLFAASMRGLIESAGDSSTALAPVPENLAIHASKIDAALLGGCMAVFVSDELEDLLIHYSHARKLPRGSDAQAIHHAKTVREYLTILERGQVPRIIECYTELCDLTHPGASSVLYWLESQNEEESVLHSDRDLASIMALLYDFRDLWMPLMMFAFNPGVMTLSVLNYFSLDAFHTPSLTTWNLSDIPLWRRVSQHLRCVPIKVSKLGDC